MSKLFKLKPILSVLCVALILITSNRCKKDDKDELPELPPVEALLMDFSFFEDSVPQNKAAVLSYYNIGYAVTNVLAWNVAATLTLAIPVAVYAEAFHHEAVYLGDNSWQWLYSIIVNPATYSVKLVSNRISNEEFTLKMIVSKSGVGGFENFTWFEGTVRYDHTSAIWNLYQSPDISYPVLNVSWTMDWEQETYTIKYVCTNPAADLHGGYIEHGVTKDTDFDAYYTISLPTNTVNIEWNRTTKVGHVKSMERFGDANWHCWDGYFSDVVCE
jgi:hypothetical protein